MKQLNSSDSVPHTLPPWAPALMKLPTASTISTSSLKYFDRSFTAVTADLILLSEKMAKALASREERKEGKDRKDRKTLSGQKKSQSIGYLSKSCFIFSCFSWNAMTNSQASQRSLH
jgi:hypothetical protein